MNITEFKKEIESLFNKLKFRYDLRGGFELQLEESVYEQNGIEFTLPTKVKLVGFDQTLEEIDLTKDSDIVLIKGLLTFAVKRIDFYEWIYDFAQNNHYEIEFYGRYVTLFSEDCKEIEIRQTGKDRFSVSGHYIVSDDATVVRHKIDSLLYYGIRDVTPSYASVKSAISSNEIYAQGFEELDKALKDTRRHLDYASERTLKMELV